MTMSPPHLIICGCGWLGKYVARQLTTTATLSGTTRDEHKASDLRARGIDAYRYSLGEDPSHLLDNTRDATVLLNIPAGRRQTDLTEYQQQMCDLVDAFAKQPIRHLIFISTTSVYGDEVNGPVTEQSPVAPDTASAKANLTIEEHIRSTLPERYTILRLAGLTGPDRHPIHMLAGRSLDKGNKPINLIHIKDVSNAIEVLFNKGPAQRTLHLCSALHPKRGDYYSACAKKRHLPLPAFQDTDKPASGKIIDATATLAYLDLTLVIPDPADMC